MIQDSFYLSDESNVEKLQDITELSIDEIESIVGWFKQDHWRFPGKLKGEVVLKFDGSVVIRHHFNKKVLWTQK